MANQPIPQHLLAVVTQAANTVFSKEPPHVQAERWQSGWNGLVDQLLSIRRYGPLDVGLKGQPNPEKELIFEVLGLGKVHIGFVGHTGKILMQFRGQPSEEVKGLQFNALNDAFEGAETDTSHVPLPGDPSIKLKSAVTVVSEMALGMIARNVQ